MPLRISLSLILAGLFVCASLIPGARAHVVTVDGNPADWFPREDLTVFNQGILATNAMRHGQYVWLDAPGDERTDFNSPDHEVDLREFRITASNPGMYILARFADLTLASGDGAVQIQIAVDLDGVVGSGQKALGSFCDTEVNPDAAWEYLIVTGFGSGRNSPIVYDSNFSDVDPTGLSEAAISVDHDCVEIALPWALLGGFPSPAPRFTVSVLRADAADVAWDLNGTSDVLDALTNCQAPGTMPNTWTEVGDGVVDYHFELWFSVPPGFDPQAPMLFREVLYDPSAAQLGQEWISIWNLTGGRRSLEGYRIGNAETPGSPEGMRVFPPGSEILGRAVIAQDASEMDAVWSYTPDFELDGTDPSVPDLLAPSGWGGSTIQLGDNGDELLLIDRYWTILDAVAWENGKLPNVHSFGGAETGKSMVREIWDTDDCSVDFQMNLFPVPFHPANDVPLASGDQLVLEQNFPNPFNPATMIAFELPQAGFVRLAIHDARGRLVRTLVSGWQPAGTQRVQWSGEDDTGRRVASGVYHCRIVSGAHRAERSMILVK